MKTHTGGCHCGAVRFSVEMELTGGMICNCSHCHMKGMVLAFVPNAQFKLEKGEEMLTTYNFNKKMIDHQFCKVCGVQAFGRAKDRSTAAINLRCVDELDIDSIPTQKYNGRDM